MARTATLLEMRTRAYRRAGNVNETSRFPSADVTVDVNESLADLYDRLLLAWGADRFEAAQSISITSGTSSYALASSFIQLLAVELDATAAGLGKHTLQRYMRHERAGLSDTTVIQANRPTMYALVGDNIAFLPTPTASMTATVRYVPHATKLVADGDTFNGINGWEEWVVVDVARKMATTDRDFPLVAILEADLARLNARISASAAQRDRHGHRRVVDVRRGSTRRYV